VKKPKIATFNKIMTLEQAEHEKSLDTSIGQALKKADSLYAKRRKNNANTV
jgi:hypothetical protein